MSRPSGVRGWRAAAAVLVVALLMTSTSSAHQSSERGGGRLDLVASAQPGGQSPRLVDVAYRSDWTWSDRADADTVATSSATCSGCRGAARTVEVMYVGWARRVNADNVATAWSSCTDCGSSALSVQVVVLRHPTDLRVNNRALAVNATCTRCDSSAAAYQLVVSTASRPDLDALLDEVVAWAESLTPTPDDGTLRRGTSPRVQRGSADSLGALQELVSTEAPGKVLAKSVRVQ